jgi:hypothetical protein
LLTAETKGSEVNGEFYRIKTMERYMFMISITRPSREKMPKNI